ncbi:hypothetical protein DFQ50_103317 [Pseudocitrobacter faecalis]|uniref:Uncharacterized protein n=1 Tax=Pseudocitrobacter faecalis TaxID=1398493 RepID=A0ABX9FZ76_9ENTR|nr:hypothetical protein DFQ50_103317 [Pseudocitrobacter faecalis]
MLNRGLTVLKSSSTEKKLDKKIKIRLFKLTFKKRLQTCI